MANILTCDAQSCRYNQHHRCSAEEIDVIRGMSTAGGCVHCASYQNFQSSGQAGMRTHSWALEGNVGLMYSSFRQSDNFSRVDNMQLSLAPITPDRDETSAAPAIQCMAEGCLYNRETRCYAHRVRIQDPEDSVQYDVARCKTYKSW